MVTIKVKIKNKPKKRFLVWDEYEEIRQGKEWIGFIHQVTLENLKNESK